MEDIYSKPNKFSLMNNYSSEFPLSPQATGLSASVNLDTYLAEHDQSQNPYASIDDFLDETWGPTVSTEKGSDERSRLFSRL